MNTCYNYGGCGCNSYMPTFSCNPFGCNSYSMYPSGLTGYGSGSTWFAIVLVVFLLLIICGCTKIC